LVPVALRLGSRFALSIIVETLRWYHPNRDFFNRADASHCVGCPRPALPSRWTPRSDHRRDTAARTLLWQKGKGSTLTS